MTSRTTKPGRQRPAAPPAPPTRWVVPALVGVGAVTVAVYARTLGNGFIDFDDPENVVDNPTITSFSGENIAHWFSSALQFMYTPLVSASYALDHAIGGVDPTVYHLTNLLLHLVNAALVFAVVRALLPRDGRVRRDVVAVFACAAFAIHPVNVDGVAWVATRSNLLATAFLLGSLLAYATYLARAEDRDPRRTGRRWWWLGLSLALFVGATFSKSAAVVLPVLLLLWDYAVARRWSPRVLVEKLPFFAVSLVMGVVGLNLRDDTNAFTDYTVVDRFFLACSALWAYVTRLVLPYPLSFAYAYPEKDGGALPWWVYLTPLLLAGVVALTLWLPLLRDVRRLVVFGWAFFFVTAVLSLTVLLIDNYKPNRYAYLPYVGLLLILGLVVDRLIAASRPDWLRWTTFGVLGVFAVSFCVLTVQRAGLWKDTVTLLQASIEHEPDVPFVYNSLGIARYKAGDYDGAIADLTKVTQLDPFFNVYNNLGTVQLAQGDAQAAIDSYTRALEMNPGYVDAVYNRGVARLNLGDLENACADWRTAGDMGFPLADQALVDNAC